MEIVNVRSLHRRLQDAATTYYGSRFEDLDLNKQQQYLQLVDGFENGNPWSKRVKQVPHLRLRTPAFDHARGLAEVTASIGDAFVPINLRNLEETRQLGPKNHAHWSAMALVNYTPDSDRWFMKQSKEAATLSHPELQPEAASLISSAPRLNLEDMRYYRTDLYDKMPYITDFISTHIADRTYRIFVWKIGHDGYLNWHNHASLPWHKDLITNDKAIVHIPLRSHPSIRMLVRIDDKIYSQYYEPGTTWLFNNINDHAVENSSDVDRLHIVAFVPFDDVKFCRLLEESTADV